MRVLQRVRDAAREDGLAGAVRLVVGYLRWRFSGSPLDGDQTTPTLHEWLERYAPLEPPTPRPAVGFSIICPVYNTPPDLLQQCIDSALRQTHMNWEMIVVDDASSAPETRSALEALESLDPRIRVEHQTENSGIALATNRGVSLSSKDYLVFLDHDDLLAPTALSWLAVATAQADLIYSDEDKVDLKGVHHSPFFKPGWSPRLLLSVNYVNHLTCVSRSLFDRVDGLRPGLDGVQDHDFLLRVSELPELRVAHIPNILYHWRTWDSSTSSRPSSKRPVEQMGIAVVQEALDRRGWSARSGLGNGSPFSYRPFFQAQVPEPRVKVVIPTRDRVDLLRRAVSGLMSRTDGVDLHVVIVDNGSRDPATIEYLKAVNQAQPNLEVLRIDDAFNFSTLCNRGAATGRETPYLLFMNNDVEVVHRAWLQQLVGWLESDQDVVAAGPKLLFPDQTIQHAGVIVGFGGIAGHYAAYQPNQPQVGVLHDHAREVGCLTAACLVVRTEAFWKVGGFEELLGIDFQDVDLCLKLRRDLGGTLMYDPTYPLTHLQSASRGTKAAVNGYTVSRMEFLWGEELRGIDPYYSPHLTMRHHDFRPDAIPGVREEQYTRLTPRL